MKKKTAILITTSLLAYTLMDTDCNAATPEENRPLSERNEQTLKEIIVKEHRPIPVFTASGVVATALANPTRVSEKQKQGFEEREFTLPYNIHVGALVKIVDPQAPYILSTHGFLSDKEANAVRNYLGVSERYLQNYNQVILDHPTSSAFVAANKQAAFGGKEEGYMLTKVAQQLKAEGATSVHLLGVSLGGLGVLHAAFRGKETIDSVVAFSAVTDMLDIPAAALRTVTPDGACGERYQSWSTLSTAIGLRDLLPPLLDAAHTFPEYKDASFENVCDFFFKTKRYENEEYMKELYAPYIERKILPDRLPVNTVEYLAQSNASLIAQHIEVPVFLIHAADDPAVSPAHYHNFMLAAKGNDFVQGMILRNGGHNGFTAAYGRRWEGCVLKTDVDYWSAEKVTFDKECF